MATTTPLLILHLLGFAFGLGASTVLDFRILRLLFGKAVDAHDVALAAVLSAFVRLGLLLLWLSGVGFLIRAWMVDPGLLTNPKLHAKIAIVVVLTVNGALIELIALPLLRRQCGRHLFEGVSGASQVTVLSLGVVSGVSWYAPFLLGIVRELNFGPSAAAIFGAYLGLIATGIAVALAGRHLLYRPDGTAAPAIPAASEYAYPARSALPAFSASYHQVSGMPRA